MPRSADYVLKFFCPLKPKHAFRARALFIHYSFIGLYSFLTHPLERVLDFALRVQKRKFATNI